MKLKPKLMPWVALGAGVLGFVLHLWMVAFGTDEHGLIRSAHPAIILLLLLTAGTIVVLGLAAKPLTQQPKNKKLFPPSLPACVGSCVAAAGVLVSVFIVDINAFSILAALVAAACLVFTGLSRLKPNNSDQLGYIAITAYLVLHLLQQYQHWNAEPQLLRYFFPLLALISLMITAYYRAALNAGSGNYRLFVFFHWCALFFCCISIAGNAWPFYLGMTIWLATWDCSYEVQISNNPMVLPDEVIYCIDVLTNAGHSAYVVGGCVRDHLLGLKPHDYDLCTSATPEEICDLFAQHELVRNGEKHGTIGVVLAGTLFEITTFRTEGSYSDSRHPDWVEFVSDIKEDLARRDFTVNAMAYSPASGFVDPFSGQQDLEEKVLRAVGDPKIRFQEDALRILRGVRFGVRFGLTPDEETLEAMTQCAPLLDNIAQERIYAELSKLLPLVKAQDLLRYTAIITQVIPELAPAVDFQQHSPHHAYDVYTHTAYVVESAPADLAVRFAALLHDTGKPGTYTTDETGRGHFYGHAQLSAEIADAVLLRLKAPTALRNQVVLLIDQHMTQFTPDKKVLRRRLGKLGDETVEQLLALQKADFSAKGVSTRENPGFHDIDALLAEIRLEGSCLTVKDLAVTGSDLLSLGQKPGPHIGECMNFLLSLVQDEILQNEKQELLDAAKSFFET